MGFASSDRGLKRCIVKTYPEVTYRAESTGQALDQLGASRDKTVAIIDGNCALLGVHSDVCTFEEYVTSFAATIRRAMTYAHVIILCTDNPNEVPPTKRATQKVRDAKLTPSESAFTNDAYTRESLEQCSSCRPLVINRVTRYRLFDELLVRVVRLFSQEAVLVAQMGETPAILVVDEADPRGATRPFDEPRRPQLLGTSVAAIEWVGLSRIAHGEADVKLRAVEWAVRHAIAQNRVNAETIAVITIDTDSIAIAFDQHATRMTSEHLATEDVATVICMKEQGTFAKEQLSIYQPDAKTDSAGVLLIDVGALHDNIMDYVLGDNWKAISALSRRAVSQRFVATCALSGCDFVQHIAHYDVLFSAFSQAMKTATPSLDLKCWSTSAEACELAIPFLRQVLTMVATQSTRKRKKSAVDEIDRALFNAAWVAVYWSDLPLPRDYSAWLFEV